MLMLPWLNKDNCDDVKRSHMVGLYDSVSSGVIKDSQYSDMRLCLDLWAKSNYKLENKFVNNKQGFLVKDYDFIKILGDSVYYLNVVNSFIINSVEHFLSFEKKKGEDIKNKKLEFTINEFEILNRYMRFHNNLIASKIKYYFFRETPMPNVNYPFMTINKEVVKAGLLLIKQLSRRKVNISELCDTASKYYYYQGLIYSYVFNESKGYGVFVNFKHSYSDFQNIRDRVDLYMSKLLRGNGLIGIKLFIAKFSCGILDYYIDPLRNRYISDKVLINKPKCYDDFSDVLIDENVFVEPLTFRLKDLLWKLNGILSMTKKSLITNNGRKVFDRNCNEQIMSFVNKYMNVSERMYKTNVLDYYKLYCAEKKIFMEGDDEKGLYSLLFSEDSIRNVRSRLTDQKSIKGDKRYPLKELDCKDCRSDDVEINAIAKDDESGLKMAKLIQDMNVRDLMSLLCSYAHMIKLNKNHGLREEYVGFYRSGIFLAHMVNVILDQRKYVWLFSTRPYVATFPMHKENDCVNYDRVVLFDESLKTGFTYTLYESYILRNLNKCGVKVSLYTIFDFSYYKRISDTDSCLFESVFDVNRHLKVSKKNYFNFVDAPKDFNYLSFTYKPINDIIKSIRNKDKELDLYYLLSDTDSVFSVCSDFCDIIQEKCYDAKKKVAIFSPSESGDVLAMFTALMLKIKGREIVFLQKSNVKSLSKNEAYFISIDLTFTSGFSVDYTWSIMSKNKYVVQGEFGEYIQKIENSIDLSLSVYSFKKQESEKIISLY